MSSANVEQDEDIEPASDGQPMAQEVRKIVEELKQRALWAAEELRQMEQAFQAARQRAERQKRRADLQKQRADQAKQLADQEKHCADQAKHRAETAEQREQQAKQREAEANRRAEALAAEVVHLRATLKMPPD